MKTGVSLDKLVKMEELAFKNALRLHFDSILLFKNKSYPSAFFLSILAQEEFGKVRLLNDFIFHSTVDGRMDDTLEYDWLKEIYDHKSKQKFFTSEAGSLLPASLPKSFLRNVFDGKLDILKQNSVYVGLERKKGKVNLKSKIISPFRIRSEKAQRQITIVNDYLVNLISGVIKGVYVWDTENVEKLLNKKLLSKLTKAWKFKSREAKSQFRRLQAIN